MNEYKKRERERIQSLEERNIPLLNRTASGISVSAAQLSLKEDISEINNIYRNAQKSNENENSVERDKQEDMLRELSTKENKTSNKTQSSRTRSISSLDNARNMVNVLFVTGNGKYNNNLDKSDERFLQGHMRTDFNDC